MKFISTSDVFFIAMNLPTGYNKYLKFSSIICKESLIPKDKLDPNACLFNLLLH